MLAVPEKFADVLSQLAEYLYPLANSDVSIGGLTRMAQLRVDVLGESSDSTSHYLTPERQCRVNFDQ